MLACLALAYVAERTTQLLTIPVLPIATLYLLTISYWLLVGVPVPAVLAEYLFADIFSDSNSLGSIGFEFGVGAF